MKKIILTAAIILSASMSFYAKQSASFNTADIIKTEKLSSVDKLDLDYTKGHKMDIGQADAGN